jgi:hypothetical protein
MIDVISIFTAGLIIVSIFCLLKCSIRSRDYSLSSRSPQNYTTLPSRPNRFVIQWQSRRWYGDSDIPHSRSVSIEVTLTFDMWVNANSDVDSTIECVWHDLHFCPEKHPSTWLIPLRMVDFPSQFNRFRIQLWLSWFAFDEIERSSHGSTPDLTIRSPSGEAIGYQISSVLLFIFLSLDSACVRFAAKLSWCCSIAFSTPVTVNAKLCRFPIYANFNRFFLREFQHIFGSSILTNARRYAMTMRSHRSLSDPS